jgi:hypothetical protein
MVYDSAGLSPRKQGASGLCREPTGLPGLFGSGTIRLIESDFPVGTDAALQCMQLSVGKAIAKEFGLE